MDANKTLKRLRGERDRVSHSVYVSTQILTEFKEACGEISPSRVLEELMREFVDDYSGTSRKLTLKKSALKKN